MSGEAERIVRMGNGPGAFPDIEVPGPRQVEQEQREQSPGAFLVVMIEQFADQGVVRQGNGAQVHGQIVSVPKDKYKNNPSNLYRLCQMPALPGRAGNRSGR